MVAALPKTIPTQQMNREYTIQDVRAADRMWDDMPLTQVANDTGIPLRTLYNWSEKDWISTSRDWSAETNMSEERDQIERADRLWESMPLTDVSTLLDIPLSTLYSWSRRNLITSQMKWQGEDTELKKRRRKVANMYYQQELLQKQIANRLGISVPTVSRDLAIYREGLEDYRERERRGKSKE